MVTFGILIAEYVQKATEQINVLIGVVVVFSQSVFNCGDKTSILFSSKYPKQTVLDVSRTFFETTQD